MDHLRRQPISTESYYKYNKHKMHNALYECKFSYFFLNHCNFTNKKTKRPTTIVSRPFNDVNKINILPFELVGIRALIQSYKRSGLLKILILLLLLLP